MSRITQCIDCGQQLAVPDSSSPSIRLACPHCHAEFALDDVSIIVLPEAILIAAEAAGAGVARAATPERDNTDPTTFQGPRTDASDTGIQDTVAGAVSHTDPPDDGDSRRAMTDGVGTESSLWDFADSNEEQQQVAVGPAHRNFDPIAASMVARTANLRRPRKSALRQLVGFIGGGAIGLALGYYILLWIGGPERDFLEFGEHLPTWMVPKAFSESGMMSDPGVAEESRTGRGPILESPTGMELDLGGASPPPIPDIKHLEDPLLSDPMWLEEEPRDPTVPPEPPSQDATPARFSDPLDLQEIAPGTPDLLPDVP